MASISRSRKNTLDSLLGFSEDDAPPAKTPSPGRNTTKYWVHRENVRDVINTIHQELPNTKGGSTESVTQSIYFDNEQFDRYHERVAMQEGGVVFRFRWLGMGSPKNGFFERKIRKFSYLGPTSNKLKVMLAGSQLKSFLDGSWLPEVSSDNGKQAAELQQTILDQGLMPVMRVAYTRTSYGASKADAGVSPVTVTVDENIVFSNMDRQSLFYDQPSDMKLNDDERCVFPHAVVEVKYKQTGAGRDVKPQWLESMIAQKQILAVEKFSKFTCGVSLLHDKEGVLAKQPYFHPHINTFQSAPRFTITEVPKSHNEVVNESRISILQNTGTGKKRMINPVRREPTIFLAVERTFLKWLRIAVVLAFLGITLLKTNISGLAGGVFMLGGLLLSIRSVYVYYYRMHQIKTLGMGSFYDGITPPVLVLLFIFGVLVLSYTNLGAGVIMV